MSKNETHKGKMKHGHYEKVIPLLKSAEIFMRNMLEMSPFYQIYEKEESA